MKKVLIAIYDVEAELYSDLMTFENEKLALATIRREVRDGYVNGKFTLDSIADQELVVLGKYDNFTGDVSGVQVEYAEHYPMKAMVLDLIEGEKDEVSD